MITDVVSVIKELIENALDADATGGLFFFFSFLFFSFLFLFFSFLFISFLFISFLLFSSLFFSSLLFSSLLFSFLFFSFLVSSLFKKKKKKKKHPEITIRLEGGGLSEISVVGQWTRNRRRISLFSWSKGINYFLCALFLLELTLLNHQLAKSITHPNCVNMRNWKSSLPLDFEGKLSILFVRQGR